MFNLSTVLGYLRFCHFFLNVFMHIVWQTFPQLHLCLNLSVKIPKINIVFDFLVLSVNIANISIYSFYFRIIVVLCFLQFENYKYLWFGAFALF